ncbi:unnamed protein product [Debaryomyces tyrocola]|nr:unnamed protein product [Debaryomyces tyrocola]
MMFKINWLIFIYLSLGLCSRAKINYVDTERTPGRVDIRFMNNIVEKDTTKGFSSRLDLNYTLEDCKAMRLCPSNMEYGEEFTKNLLTLDMFEVLTFTLNKNEDELRQPINDTSYWFEYSHNKFKGKAIGKYTVPQGFHYADKNKLIITVPIYLVCSLIAAVIYLNKRKLLVTMNFKFSNISRVLFKYLSLKLVFGSAYLAYLVLFVDFRTQPLGHFKILVAFTIFKYIISLASFLLVVLFAFGYCTSFFTFTNRRSILWKVCGLTLLNGIQSFPKLFYEIQDIKNAVPFFRAFKSRLPTSVAIGFIALYIVILFALAYIAYDTYKHSHKRDARFLLSFQIILAAYILSPLIVVPTGRSTIPNFIKNRYLLNDGVSDPNSQGVHVPDVIELFVIGALIYIWRDLKYVENDGDVYGKLDNGEYELEENH